MTDCCLDATRFGGTRTAVGASEVTYADMLARAVYRVVDRVASAFRDRFDRRRTMKALDDLERLDDRQLAELGISRADLAIAALEITAAKRRRAYATMGYQA